MKSSLGATVVVLSSLAMLSGCLGKTLDIGTRADTSGLTSLTQQVSTKGDVLHLLGPPSGYGAVRVRNVEGRRVVWYYEHVRYGAPSFWTATFGATGDFEMQMLLVFFQQDRYDGHLWFEDVPELEMD